MSEIRERHKFLRGLDDDMRMVPIHNLFNFSDVVSPLRFKPMGWYC